MFTCSLCWSIFSTSLRSLLIKCQYFQSANRSFSSTVLYIQKWKSDADAQVALLKLLTLYVVGAEIETSCTTVWWWDMCCCSTVISSSWTVWIQKSTWYQRRQSWQSVSQSEIVLHIWVPENQITQHAWNSTMYCAFYNHPLWLIIWSCI